jgi:hypothetical protein
MIRCLQSAIDQGGRFSAGARECVSLGPCEVQLLIQQQPVRLLCRAVWAKV